MSTAHCSRIHLANLEVLAQGRRDAIAAHFTAGYVVHVSGQQFRGHGAVAGVVDALRRAVPALTVEVDILMESAERLAWMRTCSGMQTGAFKGFPASGKPLVWRDMVVSRFEGELIAEEWVVTDLAEQLLLARKA